MAGRQVETLAKSSLIKLRSYLAQAFDFGLRRRHVVWNPARVAELPVLALSTREGRALTAPEARAMMNATDGERYGAWIVVTLMLGLRPGETSALTWEAIDGNRLTVFQSMSWTDSRPKLKGTKTGHSRTLTLPAPAQDALTAHRRRSVEERLLMGDRLAPKMGIARLCHQQRDTVGGVEPPQVRVQGGPGRRDRGKGDTVRLAAYGHVADVGGRPLG